MLLARADVEWSQALMFFARGSLVVGPAVFRSHVAVDRALRIFALERAEVTFDSSLLPCASGLPRDVDVVWFVVSGAMSWSGPASGAISGPGAVAMQEHHFDGCEGTRAFTFRSSGSPFRALELRVRRACSAVGAGRGPASVGRGTMSVGRGTMSVGRGTMSVERGTVSVERGPAVVAVGGDAHAVIAQYLSRALTGDVSRAADAIPLVDAVAREGLVSAATSVEITRDEDPRLVRLWTELARAYVKLDTRPSLKRLATASGMSLRTLSRFVTLTVNDLLLPPGSWRDSTANLRLMLSILFLSCPALSVRDVSDAVGYARPEAMANAFQRAGLLSPRDVRAVFAATIDASVPHAR